MKKIITLLSFAIICNLGFSQTVADFENINLPSSGFANGSDTTIKLESGNIILRNTYDTSGGGWWTGFSVSKLKDTITAGYMNQYSVSSGKGYNNSNNFAVAYSYAMLVLKNQAVGKAVKGFWITNNTYAYLSMKNGDSFTKKFGGKTGNDTDWLKLNITGYLNNTGKKVEFYLADFQNSDSTKDYIIKDWTWVDLSSLGNVDSLEFNFEGTDTGQYGLNTPAYFCMDNFITADQYTGLQNHTQTKELYIYPNPSSDIIYTSENLQNKQVKIIDFAGRKININTPLQTNQIDISNIKSGVYIIQLSNQDYIWQSKLIKQ